MNNQFGFSSGLGTGFNQPFTGKTVNDTINNIDKWQAETKQKYSDEKTVAMENSAKNMYECAMRTNDGQVRKQNLSGANLSNMEIIIKQAAQEHGSTAYDDLGEGQILCRFMQKNPQYEQITNGTLGGDVNLKTWARVIGANTSTPQSTNDLNINKRVIGGGGALGVGLGGYGVNRLGALSQRGGDKLYNLPIDKSLSEANKIQNVGAGIKDAESEVKNAKEGLKNAKKTGEGIEEAEKALQTAEKNLSTAKSKTVRTIGDTAMDYNIGGGIFEGWTAESRGIQASHEANQIFKNTVMPALENSKSTINVQKLIDSLADDIQSIAKNDPDKLNAYTNALNDLKESYAGKEFAKYSMKDSQTLKSGLQGRTPQKFWKGQEITNELQELKSILSTKLKNSIHEILTKEAGVDTARLYSDYANLKNYAGSMAKQSTNAGLKQGFGGFWSTAFHNLTDGAFAKGGLLLDKLGKGMQSVTDPKKIAEGVGDVWNYVVKNGKNFIKATKGKGFRVEDPVGLVELLRLAPGTIGDIADTIGESMPAVVVDDLLFEINEFKDNWNDMSDDERKQNIKDQYKEATGIELNDESVEATYEKRKEKHPNGKYGFWDTVNDVEVVIKA